MLPLFPTPYPDEILYSVLCRYHMRCGSPSARRTNIEIWGNVYGKKLFLPDGIGRFVAQIPASVGITAEKLIWNTTIFPILKPFLSKSKTIALQNDMTNGNENIYNGIGFSHIFQNVQRYLRYCEHCIVDDTEKYGEPYWHRLHQFPGVCVCYKHGIILTESGIDIADIRNEYFPLLPTVTGIKPFLSSDTIKKLFGIACEMNWITVNGKTLGCYDVVLECYDKWLQVRGYRDSNGKTGHKRLAEAFVSYYGQELLSIFDAYNCGACSWTWKITTQALHLQNPVLHILLMRFLAGSANEFFSNADELKVPEFLPFGESPYPCRNPVCECHLQDVITDIEVIHTQKGDYKATFICPHCGLTYRRKKPVLKEKQYTGQIDIVDYGWLWHEKLKEMLASQMPIRRIGMVLKCDTRTVVRLGIAFDYFPPEQYPKLRSYIAHPKAKVTFDEQREHYRNRWLAAIDANTGITRSELRMLDSKADQWLHSNDVDWHEQNSPPSQKYQPKWANNDDNYAERVEVAMNRIRDAPGRPKRVSIAAIGKMIGDDKIHRKLASGRFPKSKALVEGKSESLEDWQRRKIIWAIRGMHSRGEIITIYKVRHLAAIEDRERKWDEFIAQCIIEN